MKICGKCLESKELSEFHNDKSRNDGLSSSCKSCARERAAAWYESNREKAKSGMRERYAANPSSAKERASAWYAANPEKTKARNDAWRASNRERAKAIGRLCHQNRRSRKLGSGGKLSIGLAEKLFKLQRGKCACGCAQPLGDDYHLDHRMPLALGGEHADHNIQLLRKTCNLHKSAKHPVEFMQQRGFLL